MEACSNNCNRRFQVQLASKDFLQELKTMIGPKLQPTLAIQNKVLFLIQVKNFYLKVIEDYNEKNKTNNFIGLIDVLAKSLAIFKKFY